MVLNGIKINFRTLAPDTDSGFHLFDIMVTMITIVYFQTFTFPRAQPKKESCTIKYKYEDYFFVLYLSTKPHESTHR